MKLLIVKRFTVIIIIFALAINIFTENVLAASKLNINAIAAIAMDSESKSILFQKNSDMIIPMASTTKIMTALVALRYGNLDRKVEISKKAAAIRGSKVGYKAGEIISMKELLYGLMFRSGNDAAIAIAEALGKDIDGFSKLMNECALEIGAVNSHFESPHGLDSENHYCTAYDLALITAKAKENKLFNEIVSHKDITMSQSGFTRDYHNINKILDQIDGANGVKTGSTGKAGKCLVSSVNVDGHDVIYVVLNCTPRWKETVKLHKYVLENYKFQKIYTKGEKIACGKSLNMTVGKDVYLPIKIGKQYNVKTNIINKYNKRNCIVGTLNIYYNDNETFKIPLFLK